MSKQEKRNPGPREAKKKAVNAWFAAGINAAKQKAKFAKEKA